MNKQIFNIVRGSLLVLIAFMTLFGMRSAWADAGPGYNPSGGSCRGGSIGSAYWDTCFGVSWQYYEYNGSADVQVPGGSNSPGAVIRGSTCGAVGGFWHLGYERYIIGSKPSADSSTGAQRGTYRLGGVLNGSARFYQWGTPTSSFGGATATKYGGLNEVQTEFQRMKIQEEIEGQPGKYTNGQYWGTGSDLGWFCAHPPGSSPGEFQSRSNVRIGSGSDYETTNWIDRATANDTAAVESGATVSVAFSHDMKYTGTLPNSSAQVKKDWTYEMTINGATVQMTPSSAPAPTTGKNPYVPTNNEAQQVYQSHSYSITMPTVTTGSQTFTICEKITYQNKKLNGTSWTGGESFSRACATITLSSSPPPPVVATCPLPDSAYSIQYGGTQAQSGVANMTKDGVWKTTDGSSSTPAFVWAKPGDSIQFKHTLCFGAQSVRGSTDNGTSTSPPNDSVKPSTANKATITASTKPATSGGKYLFGNTLNGGSTQTFTVAQGASKASSGSPDQSGNYWFTYYSPSNNAASTYSCYAADRGFPSFKANGYQIPDFTKSTLPANCNAAKKASTNSDAGKIIQQNLAWNNVKAWQNTHNTGSGGFCTCNTRDAWATNTTHSYEDMKNGSYTPGTRVRKCYQSSSTGCGWCNRNPSYSTRDYYYYPINTTSSAGADQVAQVKIPFNYTTTPNVSTSQDILFGGGEYGVNVTIDVNKRSNPDVSTGSYATISKKSVYEVVAFTVAPDKRPAQIAHANEKYAGNGSKLACSYYGQGASRCLSLLRSGTVQLNDKGSLHGAVENIFNGDLAVPDAEVGTKFCVAVGVWPSDSHNYTSGPAGTGDTALDINNGAYWNYSEPTCRTITKKPTVQFHSSGVYSAGGITTSQSKKSVGNTFGQFGSGNKLQSGSVNGGSRRVYGSFSEYETIAKSNIKGFASGTGFGYGSNNGGYLTGFPALPGGYPGVPYTAEANVCTYSTQTFSNNQCKNKVTGASSINSFGSTILSRLMARYTSSSIKAMQTSTIDFSKYETMENGTKYIKVNGDASISASYCMNQGNRINSNTFVIDVSGTLTIGGNIKYGAGWGSSCNHQNYTNIAELPQMLIFAGDINIKSNVTAIDAWLISGQRDSGSGNINTCSDMSTSQIGNGYTVPKQTNSVPCSSQLKVNGPVFAKKLILNRNAGAGTGNASIQAAEIFSLRSDTYLWAYNQASRFSQAVTTYQRELAPRY